jgi:hypothetical protein
LLCATVSLDEEAFTPLFQTSFLPDLMHVNFVEPTVSVAPAFAHFAPALAAANAGVLSDERTRAAVSTRIDFDFMV